MFNVEVAPCAQISRSAVELLLLLMKGDDAAVKTVRSPTPSIKTGFVH